MIRDGLVAKDRGYGLAMLLNAFRLSPSLTATNLHCSNDEHDVCADLDNKIRTGSSLTGSLCSKGDEELLRETCELCDVCEGQINRIFLNSLTVSDLY